MKKSLIILVVLVTTGCATSQILIGHGATDTVRPGPLSLIAYDATTTTVSLRWIAVGDDSISGRATSYTVRYSTSAITEANWESATDVTGEPTPKNSGKYDSLTVSNLASETSYCFGIKAVDHAGNVSALDTVYYGTDALLQAPSETWDYIVATNGSDSDPGTLEEPFLTIGHAQSVAVAGDTIRIRAGTYHECIQFTESGTSSDYIVYSNYNGESVTIDGDNSTGREAVLGLGQSISDMDVEADSVKYIRIENANISYRYEQDLGTGTFFHPVLLGGANTHHIVLDSLTISSVTDSAEGWTKNWKHYAICILKTHDITVSGCTVTGPYGGGFKFALYFGNMIPPSYQVWENNTMTAWGSVINVGELNDYADSTKLHKSRITGNNLYGAWEEDGIQFESGYVKPSWAESLAVHSGWYVNNNDIWNCAENLIDLKGQRENFWVDGNRLWWSRGDNNGVSDGTGTEGGAGLISKARNSKYKTTWRFNEMWNSLGGMTPYVPAHVYHNTVVNNGMSHAGPRTYTGSTGIEWGQGSTGDILRYPSVTRGLGINNICAENNTTISYGGNTFHWANSDTLELDYNLYYDSTGATVNVQKPTAVDYVVCDTKAEWLAALKANPPARVIGGDSGSVWADPLFTTAPFNAQYAEHTFEVDAGSPAVDAARCLTRTINAGTGSTSLAVLNPMAVFSGWSEISLPGDTLIIGTQDPVAVTAVDNDTKIVTLAEARTWTIWTEVWLQRNGIKVNDIGARQQ